MPPTFRQPTAGLLTVDRGNTTMDCAIWRGARGVERFRFAGDDVAAAIASHRVDDIVGVAAVSVVGDGLQELERWAAQVDVPVRVAGRELRCPLPVDYPEPTTLGADRWVAALAAHRGFGGACIVIDCGTAVTIDLVDDAGRFRGGWIAPGLATMAFGLAERAPALPSAEIRSDPEAVPTSSQAAVDAGVIGAFCGAIDRGVVSLAEGAGVDGPWLVITGGDAEVYLRHGQMPTQHVPDLLHRGLIELWELGN